ncbi:Protein CBG01367 [Caenorhabditis briggsae]|uniref:Uncharacterized protein n=3 Tax=Caenorhabditis TaxID=6237 RepID=A0AAE9CYC6_CAEBR|nr:Protein CBG01367 [Caenorhabditis briggsae]PIC24287.1 hypothetical protein B9Z55_017684 [Caenorhabditis nigoni]ULT87288.1 hypothetical protein L3Y34_006818 [Caenorhabditis briggsae]UMM33027.1 hypothetical protein L5515_006643 [Caenorhabditis briggsae]CAP22648.1 Protein CBG01367 [Caenorhabditis briggsae]
MISAQLFFLVLLIACLLAFANAQWGYGYRPYGYGGYGGYGGWGHHHHHHGGWGRPWGYRPYGWGWGK